MASTADIHFRVVLEVAGVLGKPFRGVQEQDPLLCAYAAFSGHLGGEGVRFSLLPPEKGTNHLVGPHPMTSSETPAPKTVPLWLGFQPVNSGHSSHLQAEIFPA